MFGRSRASSDRPRRPVLMYCRAAASIAVSLRATPRAKHFDPAFGRQPHGEGDGDDEPATAALQQRRTLASTRLVHRHRTVGWSDARGRSDNAYCRSYDPTTWRRTGLASTPACAETPHTGDDGRHQTGGRRLETHRPSVTVDSRARPRKTLCTSRAEIRGILAVEPPGHCL